MVEWVEIGPCRVCCGDCMEVLPTLEIGAVDAVLMDPPYGISHTTSHGATWQNPTIAGDENTYLRDAVIEWASGRDLPWCAFGTWKVATPRDARGVLVWDKGPAFGMGDLSFPWKASWEEIAVGGPGWKGTRDEGVLRNHIVVSWESKGRVHPHEKPVSLVQAIIAKLPACRVVLDPFMGSGTTLVACLRSGRGGIGIECDPHYFAVAVKRLQDELTSHPLCDLVEPVVQGSIWEGVE